MPKNKHIPLPGLPVCQPHQIRQCACAVCGCDVTNVGSSLSSFNSVSKF